MKGVIFDLDGVLVSTDEIHFQAWSRLADELGITNYSKEDNERQRGISRRASLEVLLEKDNRVYSEEEKEELAERKNSYYVELLQKVKADSALPGALETLRYLKMHNIMTAVGSASKNAITILERTGLLQYLDAVSCGLDVTKSKPDPEVFLVAAQKLHLKPSDCLVVEDAHAGIQAAHNGNMLSLGVGPLHEQLGADYHASSLEDVENWEEILWKK